MATKEVWIGSVGPFLYDDGDVYADNPLLSLQSLRATGDLLVGGSSYLKNTGVAGITLGFEDADGAGKLVFNGADFYLRWDANFYVDGANELWFRDSDVKISSANDGHLDLEADVQIDFNQDAIIESGFDLFFRDNAIRIGSDDDGHLDLVADTQIDVNQHMMVEAGYDIRLRDAALTIGSDDDGHIDIGADVQIDLNNPVVCDSTLKGNSTVESVSGFIINGSAGASGTTTVVTGIQAGGAGAVGFQYKTRDLTFSGGIITVISAESGWNDV